MSEANIVAIAIAGVSLAGQLVNVLLHLRIRTAILEQDKAAAREVDEKLKEYVQKETCFATHHPNARQRY